MITVEGLKIEIGDRTLISSASFIIHHGQKVGLVGKNGAGKSTLLSVLVQDYTASIEVHGSHAVKGSLGFLAQTPSAQGLGIQPTVISHVLQSKGLDLLEEELRQSQELMEDCPTDENILHFSETEEHYRISGGYEARSDISRLLDGVGCSVGTIDKELRVLSGGERRRVELVRVLYGDFNTLILDEPTNHLDLDAKAWLMQFLATYAGALLIVSHDLVLLDKAISRVMHLEQSSINEYKGSYSQYLKNRALDAVRKEKMAGQQEREIHRLATLADSMRHSSAKRARVAKSLDKRVTKLTEEKVAPLAKQRNKSYKFPPPARSSQDVLEVKDLWKAFGSKIVLTGLSFRVERGEKLVIFGINGAGKSTLLRIIAGTIEADIGAIVVGKGVNIGHYEQEHENLDFKVNAIENITASELVDQEKRRILGMFDIVGDMAYQRTGTLSGGERTKLSLAQLFAGEHNLLLLDEPTNNLDPASRESVAKAFDAWTGTAVMISHDRMFVDAIHPNYGLRMPDGKMEFWKPSLLDEVERI